MAVTKNLPAAKIFLSPDRSSAEVRKMIDPLIGVGHAGRAALGRKPPKPLSFPVIVLVLSRRQTLTKEKENEEENDWGG